MEFVEGLKTAEVSDRQARGQVNKMRKKHSRSCARIVFDNLFTLFNGFNAAIAVCLALVGAWVNIAFLAIIILNAAIGITEEIHAKNMVARLSLIHAPTAAVMRDGKETRVPVEQLVADDVLLLAAGDQVPADAVFLSGAAELNESLLTGEAAAVAKKTGDELLSGSYLTGGRCCARVIRVGEENFAAKLAAEGRKRKAPSSELKRSMSKPLRSAICFALTSTPQPMTFKRSVMISLLKILS